MKCQNCGSEIQEGFGFCSKCGAPVTYSPAPQQPILYEQPESVFNPFAQRMMASVQDKSFLIICILMTVACGCAIIKGSFNVINILFTIFLWLAFSSGRKNELPNNHLRCVSGTVYAFYVLTNVGSIICIICGIIFAVAFSSITGVDELYIKQIMDELGITLNLDLGLEVAKLGLAFIGLIFGIVFTVVGALILIFNLLGMKKIHRFVKSVYQSVASPTPYIAYVTGAKGWLMFFGICSVFSSVSAIDTSFLTVVASACQGVAGIIASIMVGRHFENIQSNNVL